MGRKQHPPKRTTLSLASLATTTGKKDISHAFRVHPKQVAEANAFAQSVDCGAPFEPSGDCSMTRATKKRYMRELNTRRADLGEERLVNFDGGHGDET